MYIKEGKGKLALFYTASNALLTPLLFIFYFPPPPQFYYSPSSIFLFPFFPPPPPPHFYCFPSTTATFLLFSLHHRHISIVFPPPPPPPHLYDKPVNLDILNEIPSQVNEILAYFIHEIKTIAYDVSDVDLFPPTLMRFPPKKEE